MAYCFRAFSYLNIGEYLNAIEDYSIAIKLDPTYDELYSNRSYCYHMIGEEEKSLNDYEMAKELFKNNY